jgi:hypothetical protein
VVSPRHCARIEDTAVGHRLKKEYDVRQEEELLFPFSDYEIDQLYTQGYNAGRRSPIGRENQTPLEAAEEAGWHRIHIFDTRLTVQEGAVGIGPYRDVIAITDDAEGLWAVNITAESEREG